MSDQLGHEVAETVGIGHWLLTNVPCQRCQLLDSQNAVEVPA